MPASVSHRSSATETPLEGALDDVRAGTYGESLAVVAGPLRAAWGRLAHTFADLVEETSVEGGRDGLRAVVDTLDEISAVLYAHAEAN